MDVESIGRSDHPATAGRHRPSPGGIEQVKTDSWNNEQIHGGNVRRVVTKEGLPRARDLRQVGRGLGVRYVPDCARERFMVASGIGRRDDPAVRSRVL